MGRSSALATALLGFAAAPTAFATPSPSATKTVEAIAACRSIAADAARLACYDRAAASMVAAKDKGELIVLDRATVVERRRQSFGLAMDADPAVPAPAVKELDTTIVAVVRSKSYGRFDMQLANGSVWQTIEPIAEPSKGDAIKIKVAPLGGFKATIRTGRAILVKRIR